MKQLRLPIFRSKIKIYSLRVLPPDSVFEDVVSFKKQFKNEFGKQPLSSSKPHITIATFRMNSKYQDQLIAIFEQLSRIEKFKLDIGGFTVFENKSDILLLKVSKTPDIERLNAAVKPLLDNNLGRKFKSFRISNVPHITISTASGKELSYKSLAHFKKIGYSKKIEVGDLTLASRLKHKGWDWEHQIPLS